MALFGSNTERDDIPKTKDEFLAKVEEFVGKEPNALYLIDGDKNSARSVICRQNSNGGQTCLNVDTNGITLFKVMQKIDYFCSLPAEVDATHFECRKVT